ncbi:MAG: cbb3-type cytochrome c oxidase subunit I [Candidatus Acidiferrales bacterium]
MAKLFGGLAVVLAVFTFLPRGGVLPSGAALDLYLHDTYYVIGLAHVAFIGAIVCAILAFICFAFDRWTARPLSQPIGLVSFACVAIALVCWLTATFFMRRALLPMHWQIGMFSGAIFSFVLGCVLFGGSLAWAIFRMIWSRFSFR